MFKCGRAEVFEIRVANSFFLENHQKSLQKSQICRTPLTGGVAKRSAKKEITRISKSSALPHLLIVMG